MDILKDLNPDQQAAVQFQGSPLLILAGAGSGKTRVLTHRVAHLIGQGVAAENILLMTFTNKASEEMLRRVDKIIASQHSGKVMGGTFHSFCAKVLRKYGMGLGIDPYFVIFDPGDQLDTIKQAMSALGLDSKAIKPTSILATISSAKNELVKPEAYTTIASGPAERTAAKVFPVYEKILHDKFRRIEDFQMRNSGEWQNRYRGNED